MPNLKYLLATRCGEEKGIMYFTEHNSFCKFSMFRPYKLPGEKTPKCLLHILFGLCSKRLFTRFATGADDKAGALCAHGHKSIDLILTFAKELRDCDDHYRMVFLKYHTLADEQCIFYFFIS